MPNTRLLYKVQNININKFKNLRPQYKKVKTPKKAATFSISNLLKNNGNSIDIITFYSVPNKKNIGNILRRYIITKGLCGEEIREKNYIQKGQELVDRIFNSKSRKIKTKISLNGKNIREIDETQAVTEIPNGSVVHIKKITSTKYGENCNLETQSLYSYQKNLARKGYEISSYLRTKNHFLNPREFNYHFERFPVEKIKEFIMDKYFLLHLYSFDEFKNLAPSIAIHPNHKLNVPCKIEWRNDMGKYELGNMDGDYFSNKKTMFLNKNANKNRNIVISTAAHENEHAYEFEQIYNLIMQNLAMNEYRCNQSSENYEKLQNFKHRFPVDDAEKTIKYQLEYIKYIHESKDSKGYFNQNPEIRARYASILAEAEYYNSSQKIKAEFPYAPDSLIGGTEAEKIDYDCSRNFVQETKDIMIIKQMEEFTS